MATSPASLDLVGVGVPYADVLLRVPHLPGPDEALRVLDRDVQGGGEVPTACCAAARLGCRAAFIGAAAGEGLAAAAVAEFGPAGVDTAGIQVQPGRRGPLSVILVEGNTGARSILWDEGDLALIELTAANRARITTARYLLVSEPFPAATEAARPARESGVTVVWDADAPDPAADALMPLVEHTVASSGLAATLGGRDAALGRLPGAVVMVTLGRDGVVGCTNAGPFRLPAFAVDVVDTTGLAMYSTARM